MSGLWVVACDVDEPVKVGNIFPAVGLDVGLTHFAMLSNGETMAGPQYLREELRELRRA
jgi:transposase